MAPRQKKTKADQASATGTVAQRSTVNQPPPNWPELQPVRPADDLELLSVLPNHIITVPNLWTSNLCKTMVSFLASLPLTTTPGMPKKGEALRVNDRFQIDDPTFAEKLWSTSALRELVHKSAFSGNGAMDDADKRSLWGGDVLGLNSRIRIYRYSKGQFFDQHYDESNQIMFPSSSSPGAIPAKTTWTLLLYLSSPSTGCEGGETVFYPEPVNKRQPTPPPVIVQPEVGMALLHRHGNECLLHEGREVTAGEKWIIRSDLCVKR